jgi:hypothetical protein
MKSILYTSQVSNLSCHELKHDTLFEWRCDLKMNFSGTTKECGEEKTRQMVRFFMPFHRLKCCQKKCCFFQLLAC